MEECGNANDSVSTSEVAKYSASLDSWTVNFINWRGLHARFDQLLLSFFTLF